MADPTARLRAAGVSVWPDDLSRERLTGGSLAALRDRGVSGVTTNPAIFAKAIAGSDAYDAQLRDLKLRQVAVDQVLRELTTHDVRQACDVLRPVLDDLAALGIDYDDVVQTLEDHGVAAFDASYLQGKADRETIVVHSPDWYDASRVELLPYQPQCGLGTAVLEALAGTGLPLRVRQCAVSGLPGSGTPDELMDATGISAARIANAARELIKD